MKELHPNTKEKQTTLKIGFYGCNDQIVRVGYVIRKGTRAPNHVMVDCPACGRSHVATNFMFRPVKSADEFELAEVKV